MRTTEHGDLNPRVVIQTDERACLSAAMLSATEPDTGFTEEGVSDILVKVGVYEPGSGAKPKPARALDEAGRQIGIGVEPLYDLGTAEGDSSQTPIERLACIQKTLEVGRKALLFFPKRRPERTIGHFVVISGYANSESGNGVVVMDPSEVDGGRLQPTWSELQHYVTPSEYIPVMGWSIGEQNNEMPKKGAHEENLSAFDLLTKPLFKPEDNGRSLPPGTDHATSVVMATAAINRAFYDFEDAALSRAGEEAYGYPRFIILPTIKKLAQRTGKSNCLPFPSLNSAIESSRLESKYGAGTVDIHEEEGVYWLEASSFVGKAWQHAGLGMSSRQAQAIMEGRPHNNLERRHAAESKTKKVISEYTGAESEDIFLFPTGMAAIYWLNKALGEMSDGAPIVQFGFPYTDTFEQRRFGRQKLAPDNMLDLRDADYARLADEVSTGNYRGIFTEYPSNPLLWTPDFDRIHGNVGDDVPVVVDDTVGTMFNLDNHKLPENVVARVTSLTKFFSSVGDVMGGSVVLRRESPYYDWLKATLSSLYEDTIWYEDAETLAYNSQLFPAIMPQINQNGEELAKHLQDRWAGRYKPLKQVYHPSLNGTETYDQYKKTIGGYGGLIALKFNDPKMAYKFYDDLEVTKGPSLGTYFTLACLYTWLAHKPVDFVSKFGVTPDIVRISAGIEDDLVERFDKALRKVN